MSSFPLTNSYFSRWLVNHQPVFFWRFFLVNFQQKQNTSHSGPGTLQVARARIFVLSLAAGPCPSPKNARSFGGAGDYRCFFRRNLRWAKMFVVKIGGIRVSSALNLKEQLLYACVSRQHTLLPCAGSTFIHSYLRHVRRHPKPSARSAVGIKKTPGTIFWYPMELGKSSTLRGHTLW
jgi:hypothetical protein